MSSEQQSLSEKLVLGYNRMLERAREVTISGKKGLSQGIEEAMEKASELGELSREESLRVGDYLKRDVESAVHYLDQSGKEFKEWFLFDLQLVEDRVIEQFRELVDHTREEYLRLDIEATLHGEWHTGEVAGIGTLECKGCGEQVHFHQPGHIPPCPKCHGTTFRRVTHED